MQDIFSIYENKMHNILSQLHSDRQLPEEALQINFTTEPPREPHHGDIAYNVAMVLAPVIKKKPIDIAAIIIPLLEQDEDTAKCTLAGAGFINITLKNSCWHRILGDILKNPVGYGASNLGHGNLINVEYVSANPTGPLHIAHARGAVLGDVIAELLDFCGYNVTREYYINDQGSQIDSLTQSFLQRYQQKTGHENSDTTPKAYPGEYLIDLADELYKKDEDKWLHVKDEEKNAFMKDYVLKAMMQNIKLDLQNLGVIHDVFFYESALHSKEQDSKTSLLEKTLQILRQKNMVRIGRLPPPKAVDICEWDMREQELFCASIHGDDADRPLFKQDGSPTYFANDIAYHYDKFTRGFNQMLDILGADHAGYFKRIKSSVTTMSQGKASLDICSCQMVRLVRNGKPVNMSKRTGEFVTLQEVLKEVGVDALRFTLLLRKNDMPIDFDLEKVKQNNAENPVFYVQYAYARLHSALRKAIKMFSAKSISLDSLKQADFSFLDNENELSLIKKMAQWPTLVRYSAIKRQPHRLAFYLHELAAEFHSYWSIGKKIPQARFLNEENPANSHARIALLKALEIVFGTAMAIIGITRRETM